MTALWDRKRIHVALGGVVLLTLAWFVTGVLATDLLTKDRVLNNADWEPVVMDMDGVAMVLVPAGCFDFGANDGPRRLRPARPHCIDAPFWLDRTEVTHAQYARCVEAGVCTPPRHRETYDDPAFADHPVVAVSWQQAQMYAQWRGGCLPTEAQWAYAARGPDSLLYPWGNTFDARHVVSRDPRAAHRQQPVAVGSFPAGQSWVGAHDMSGNVWEWTATPVDAAPTDVSGGGCAVPAVTDETILVIRGGSFLGDWYDVQALTRLRDQAGYVSVLRGFRVLRPA